MLCLRLSHFLGCAFVAKIFQKYLILELLKHPVLEKVNPSSFDNQVDQTNQLMLIAGENSFQKDFG